MDNRILPALALFSILAVWIATQAPAYAYSLENNLQAESQVVAADLETSAVGKEKEATGASEPSSQEGSDGDESSKAEKPSETESPSIPSDELAEEQEPPADGNHVVESLPPTTEGDYDSELPMPPTEDISPQENWDQQRIYDDLHTLRQNSDILLYFILPFAFALYLFCRFCFWFYNTFIESVL